MKYLTIQNFVFLTIFFVLGCGLDDYHARMDVEKRRMKVFDDEDRALEAFIEAPSKKNKDKQDMPAWPFEIFFRPPRGFETKRLDKDAGTPDPAKDKEKDKDTEKDKDKDRDPLSVSTDRLVLYRYPGPPAPVPLMPFGQKPPYLPPNHNLFIAGAKVGQKNKDGVVPEGEFTPDDFRRKTILALNEYYRKVKGEGLPIPPPSKEPGKEKRQPDPLKVQMPEGLRMKPVDELEYDTYVIHERDKVSKEPWQFLLYFHRSGGNQVAIVFQVPKKEATDTEFLFRLDYSLKSLDIIDNSAREKRQEFAAYRVIRPTMQKKS